jgi:hypothetical protein
MVAPKERISLCLGTARIFSVLSVDTGVIIQKHAKPLLISICLVFRDNDILRTIRLLPSYKV